MKALGPVIHLNHEDVSYGADKQAEIRNGGPIVKQRAFTRIPYSTNVFVKTMTRSFTAPSIDISIRGVFVRTREHLAVGESAEVDLVIPSASVSSLLKLPGTVTRVERGGVAIEFGRMDADTFILLKNVLHRRTTHRLKPFMTP